MSGTLQQFPNRNTPYQDADGLISGVWYRFLHALWLKTGGGTSSETIADLQTSVTTLTATKVAKAGDTMTGTLVLAGVPADAAGAVPRSYVDAETTARVAADTSLSTSITTEATARAAADVTVYNNVLALGYATAVSSLTTVATIAALRLKTTGTLAASQCYVMGYTSNVDGGEGIFEVVPSDVTSTDNGGTIIVDASARRWYRIAATGALWLEWFGGGTVASAATNTAAIASLVSASGSASVAIALGRGTYNFSAAITITLPSATAALSIIGTGTDETILNWAAGGGLTIACAGVYNSVHIRDVTFTTGINGSTNALAITQTTANAVPAYTPVSDITNVAFRGSDGWGQTHYWGAAIVITSLSNVNFANVNISGPGGAAFSTSGIGVSLAGTLAATAVVYNFAGCTFNLLNKGFVYGTYTQGVTFTQCNFTGCSYGMFNAAALTGLDELAVTGCQFACSVGGIVLATSPNDACITGNLFLLLVANGIGLQLTAPNFCAVVGNSFRGNGLAAQDGIVYTGATNAAGTITGNCFFDMTTGVWLQASISAANVQSNNYVTVTASVVNAGVGNTVGGGSS